MGLKSANLNGGGKVFIAIQVFIRLHIGTDSSLYVILITFSWDIVIPDSLSRVNKATTSNVIVFGECGKFPPSMYCHANVFSYLHRLLTM